MSQNSSLYEEAARAEDLQGLLDHIAWTDTLEPRLRALREDYSKVLVNHLLGTPLENGLTKEQLAGRIYGIDWITNLIRSVLTRGKKAVTELQYQGISLK